jgi:hypothetical protein
MKTQQEKLTFPTSAPINIERLSGQNRRLYDYLISGGRITCMSDKVRKLRIGYLNSRISDLRNKYGVPIVDHFTEVKDIDGNWVLVKEYFIKKSTE